MKTLYLVRHAKSSWDDPFQDDFDRPLNSRGRADAPRIGKRLRERDIHPDLLLSSPAERAISTCILIAGKLGYPLKNIQTDKRLYHASTATLLKVVHEMNDANDEVMLFSHNPGLTEFANSLVPEAFTDNVPTCGIVGLVFSVNSWAGINFGTGALQFFDFPKNRRGLG